MWGWRGGTRVSLQMVEQTPVWASAQAVLETETGRPMPHLSARATAAATAAAVRTVPVVAVAADVSTRVPLLQALAEHMRFFCGQVRLDSHTNLFAAVRVELLRDGTASQADTQPESCVAAAFKHRRGQVSPYLHRSAADAPKSKPLWL